MKQVNQKKKKKKKKKRERQASLLTFSTPILLFQTLNLLIIAVLLAGLVTARK